MPDIHLDTYEEAVFRNEIGRLVPALLTGAPPADLVGYSTLFVQVADFSLVVPMVSLAGLLLL